MINFSQKNENRRSWFDKKNFNRRSEFDKKTSIEDHKLTEKPQQKIEV